LAGLDQNTQGNAGAQPNPPPNMLRGFDIPLCKFNHHTGMPTGKINFRYFDYFFIAFDLSRLHFHYSF
jgi:hypothetical protein